MKTQGGHCPIRVYQQQCTIVSDQAGVPSRHVIRHRDRRGTHVSRHNVGEAMSLDADLTEVDEWCLPYYVKMLQHFEHGCRLPAHGTLTVDVRSGQAWRALEELARTKSAVVLQRPDGGALEMRLGELAKSRNVRVASGSQTSCTVTYCWRSP